MTRPPTPRSRKPLAFAAVALLAVGAFVFLDAGRWLTLDALRAGHAALVERWQTQPAAMLAGYFAVYVLAAALSIPSAAVLTLAGGAIFGFWVGVVLVSFASSVGALVAFALARTLLRDAVQARLGHRLAAINHGMARDGFLYLLTLRLVPVFPFWLVNLLVALTPVAPRRFYLASQLGMLPATVVWVNAGTQLAALRSPSDVLSPALFASLALLGVLPWLAKGLAGVLQRRRVYAAWPKPARFERNLVVIGAGAGGLVTAYLAAAMKARVTLVERGAMGGDCLNTGCVPSKTLLRIAKGARAGRPVDFAAAMDEVQRVMRAIAPHDSVERYTALGVEVLQGEARIVSPWAVEITRPDGGVQVLTTRSIAIATGARPVVPAIPGVESAEPMTSETVWRLRERPRRLLVLGGGPIGCELAQAFARLGSEVTLLEAAPRLLPREDAEASALVHEALAADGVRVLFGGEAVRFERDGDRRTLLARHGGREVNLDFDALLCATGRRPRVDGLGLEALGIPLTARGTVETDAALRTRYPNIVAVGDVAGPWQHTHTAAHQAWTATVNALFGRFWRTEVDDRAIPAVTFTEPEVARVGLTEAEAEARGLGFEVTRYGLDDLDRAIADDRASGFVKVLTERGRDRILGVTIVGALAGEQLAEFTLAMQHGLGLGKILGTVHPYPTWSEGNKMAAGAWRRTHAPRGLLRWLERFHAWARG